MVTSETESARMNNGNPYMRYGYMCAGAVLCGTIAAGCDRAGNVPKPVTAAEKSQSGGHSPASPPDIQRSNRQRP